MNLYSPSTWSTEQRNGRGEELRGEGGEGGRKEGEREGGREGGRGGREGQRVVT